MLAVNPPCDPFFHQKAFEMKRAADNIGCRCLEHQRLSSLGINGEINVAATAAMQIAQDAVTINHAARFQDRRQRQLTQVLRQLLRIRLWQLPDTDNLHRQIIGATRRQGLRNNGSCRLIQVGRVLFD